MANFIWTDAQGVGRSLYAMFRRNFTLQEIPESVPFHVFADTFYKLYINGNFIGFGPIRFDPRYPRHDTYDLAKYLRVGKNTIAILVNSIQHKVFHTCPAGAGLIAWGQANQVDLSTQRTNLDGAGWVCKKAEAYRPANRLSFALQEAELYDQSKEDGGWTEVEFDDTDWQSAVYITDQERWGPLRPRNIPYMDLSPVRWSMLTGFPLLAQEKAYSFAVETLFLDSEPPANTIGETSPIVCETWIWSPVEQLVPVGVHWAEHWLNGERTGTAVDVDPPGFRQQSLWSFNKGWNHYLGVAGPRNAVTQHYFGLPEGRGLVVSADKDQNSTTILKRTTMSNSMAEHFKNHPLPWQPSAVVPGGWTEVGEDGTAQSPCLEYCWDSYGTPPEKLANECLEESTGGWTFRKDLYPHGFSILIDLGKMRLFLPTINIEGGKGATVDLIYGEQLTNDGSHIRVLPWVPLGDRALVSEDNFQWNVCHVRGTRFLAITVRNTSEDVRLSLNFRRASYPVNDIGEFTCSDPALTAIWNLCKETQKCNMEDAYVDCSGRERGMYIRDTIIQFHNNLALFGDRALFARCMELVGQSSDATGKFRAVYPNTGDYTIADFALNAVEGFWANYIYSGDSTLIEEYWEAIKANLSWFDDLSDERPDKLLDASWPENRGIKAMYGGFHGDNSLRPEQMDRNGPHCGFTCTYLMALKAAQELALVIGKLEDAKRYNQRIGVLEDAIKETFWDDERCCYADTLTKKTWSVQTNVLAVLAGLVHDGDMADGIKNHVSSMLKNVFINGFSPAEGVVFSPHFSYYILGGLYEMGLAEVAQDSIRQGWGWMLAQGLTTCPEFYSLNESLCHAWSASPAWYLSTNILGVRFQDKPILNTITIRVEAPGIQWAEGVYPHPLGTIKVKWHMEKDQRIFDEISVPPGCQVIVEG